MSACSFAVLTGEPGKVKGLPANPVPEGPRGELATRKGECCKLSIRAGVSCSALEGARYGVSEAFGSGISGIAFASLEHMLVSASLSESSLSWPIPSGLQTSSWRAFFVFDLPRETDDT